jgi:hypothetical protein
MQRKDVAEMVGYEYLAFKAKRLRTLSAYSEEPEGRCRTSLEGGNRGARRGGCSGPSRYGDSVLAEDDLFQPGSKEDRKSLYSRAKLGDLGDRAKSFMRALFGKGATTNENAAGHRSAPKASAGGLRRDLESFLLEEVARLPGRCPTNP